jgi:hypothetical protein
MTIEDRMPTLASARNWASYVDELNTAGSNQRTGKTRLAASSPAAEGRIKISPDPANWADYIDRLYIDRLMLSLKQ